MKKKQYNDAKRPQYPLSRRNFIKTLAASGALMMADVRSDTLAGSGKFAKETHRKSPGAMIDRRSLVRRHNPMARTLDPLSPLTVGNGEFAFTADITGLQTFPEEYERSVPLCTMSHWGWHTTPAPPNFLKRKFRLTMFETHGRDVGYAVDAEGQADLYRWLRENPHRLHLGRIRLGLVTPHGGPTPITDLSDVQQQLDLWSGLLSSQFRIRGRPVSVTTAVHPSLDMLAVGIESELIGEGLLSVKFEFPYGSPTMQAADWTQAESHRSELRRTSKRSVEIHRRLDADEYFVTVYWERPAEFLVEGRHSFALAPDRRGTKLEFVASFSQARTSTRRRARVVFLESERHWARFWETGAAVELADSRDKRALELERRTILSQYLTAIQCAGSMPPQETGLTANSWYGKFHLEMHWWHAAHFVLWNRTSLLERSLHWYREVLPRARELARLQGYTGARWPKMTGPDGRDSPSPIGPLLIWQQPHPISYAELCYKQRGDRRVLQRYREIVMQTAEFMASFPQLDDRTGRYQLGPPVIPAQENHPPRETWNPTFELAYWVYGLKIAQRWRERLGLARNPKWDKVIDNLSPLPVRDGVYLAHENCPQTYCNRNYDHPSMLAALGMLPGDGVDRNTMLQTLRLVLKSWQWERTWGWDYPLTAMTAARLEAPNLAVDALLMQTEKNRYLANGHNYQRTELPCYLPGNGGLLYAVALMAAGWRSAPRRAAPGFPGDGSWVVDLEGFNRPLLATL